MYSSANTVTNYAASASKLKAAAHPVRLQILDMLRSGEVCVCHIERALNRRQAYISQQLMILRNAELVAARREGLQVYYRLADRQLAELLHLLYGPVQRGGLEVLAGCNCPTCAAAPVPDPTSSLGASTT